MALSYKVSEDGSSIKMDDEGRPLVIDDANDKEFGLDAIDAIAKITTLQAEAKNYREERDGYKAKVEAFGDLDPEDVANKLKAFGDIDPEAAKEAINTVANLDQLDQERNIEVEKIKDGVHAAYKVKINDIDKAHATKVDLLAQDIANKDLAIRKLLIRGAFDNSAFIANQTVLPSEVAYNQFGNHFEVEEEKGSLVVVARNYKGDRIMSLAKPGEYAPPEEAIELLINDYSQKDSIMRTTAGGSGAGGNISSSSVKKQQLRELAGMDPGARLAALRRINAQ